MMVAPTGGTLTGVASIDAILRLAHYLPVFPCLAREKEALINGKPKLIRAKSPHIPNGFLKASQDESQIRAWWKRWPDALVGVPMGQTTGLIAVDYDPGKHTDATSDWIQNHADALMSARIHGTLRRGHHYLYRIPAGQRYRTGSDLFLDGKIRNGIDLRAEGGYVIWWPLHGGNVTNEQAPFLPAGLIEERSFASTEAAPQPRQDPSPEAWNKDRHLVADALAYLDPSARDVWLRVGMALHLATGGNDDGFEMWHAWSAGEITGEIPHTYCGLDDCRYNWASFNKSNGSKRVTTLGSLFFEAKARGWATPARTPPPDADEIDPNQFPPVDTLVEDETPAEAPQEAPEDPIRRPMKWTALESDKPPERVWHISHWLSTTPTLLAGAGGIGKTLIAQTIATALAIGQNFIDEIEEPVRVLFWACEDEHDELWRRQIAICEYFGITLASLEGKLIIEPRIGCDNTLYTTVFNRAGWTPLRDELRDQIGDYKADVLFLDNIAQTYGANENDRHQATSFVNGIIGMGSERPFCPVLMGHPSRGIGSEFSGSSAWENAMRMRWYMGATLPDQKPDEAAEEADPNVRFLAKRKTNYSVTDYRKLHYKNGVFVPEKQENGFSQRYNYAMRKEGAISAVMHSVHKFNGQQIRVTDGKNSPDYLPRKMREAKLAQDYSQRELAEAMAGLRLQGRLIVTKVGSYQNRTPMTGLATSDYRTK
jgi:hypothetical protein